MRRRLLPLAVCAVLVGGCESDEPQSMAPTRAVSQKALEGAPAPLAALHDQGSELLKGGAVAFEQRLERLEGYPVVVNKWASWCPPCRAEFPFFESQSKKRAGEVVFLGLDAEDNDSDAAKFLEEYPVDFPSFKDPNSEIAASIDAAVSFPTTVFIDSKGKQSYVRQGGYSSEQKLAEDIERYGR